MITIDLSTLYQETAKLSELPCYEDQVRQLAGDGNDITLTGAAPVWLYLRLSHTLHGKAKSLHYDSPVTGKVLIYDHNPF